ncbi:MAG: hypothetical protein U0401_29725 [Anaerolineae bacterium]
MARHFLILIRPLLFGLFWLVLATTACAMEAASTDFIQNTPTPKSTATPLLDNNDPNYVLTLPKEVKSSGGAIFTIKLVELLKSIDTPTQSYTPKNGIYLWLIGTIGNLGEKHLCAFGRKILRY